MILHLPINRGICLTPWLIIIPKWARGDAAYLAHEQVHAEQLRRIGVIRFWWRYLRDKRFRLAMEIPAFKAQCAIDKNYTHWAWCLATEYNLDISQEQAFNCIRD